MEMRKTICLWLLLLLWGCTAPELLPPPQPTAGTVPPFTPRPSREVTLPTTAQPERSVTPAPGATLPAGVALTLRGEGTVNLRSGPGTIYPVVARLGSGAPVWAIARVERGDWLLVTAPELPGGQAWVYAPYTDYDAALQPLPVATARP
jgi:hypothetical protein